MLSKLMKYELRSTGRFFLPVYVALTVVAVINRLFIEFNAGYYSSYYSTTADVSQGTAIFLYVLLILIACVATFAIMINRFNKNLLSDEGYLMFTLPVKTDHLIFSKMFTSMLWSFATGIVTAFSLFILFADEYFFYNLSQDLQYFFDMLIREGLTAHFTAWLFEGIALVLIGSAAGILVCYAAIAIGHLSKKHRMITSVAAYIGIVVLNQFIFSFTSVLVFRADWFYDWYYKMSSTTQAHTFLLCGIVVATIEAVLYYIIVKRVLTTQLNLE